MNSVGSADNQVVPYFANLAAIGLVSAYHETGERRYLVAAEHWADWYARHMNSDGTVFDYTGSSGAWRSTGKFDSTDSYAATYLELLNDIGVQDKSWAAARYATAGRAVGAVRLTLQPDGLTLAKPTWPVAYTMDNVETERGLRSAATLATRTGHSSDAAAWNAMAMHMETSIQTNLWDSQRENYCVAIQRDGGRIPADGKWYPDLMANLMAIGLGHPSDRNVHLYHRLVAQYGATIPATAKTEEDVEHLVWWGFAAKAAGDVPRLANIRAALAAVDPETMPIGDTALLGHACRLLADK